jgi:hypothetical protein
MFRDEEVVISLEEPPAVLIDDLDVQVREAYLDEIVARLAERIQFLLSHVESSDSEVAAGEVKLRLLEEIITDPLQALKGIYRLEVSTDAPTQNEKLKIFAQYGINEAQAMEALATALQQIGKTKEEITVYINANTDS